ncbi:protein of unknown function [Paraburkholderia dioscoreae]|uniref:Uncharacterized protein n=1 Tax=Paraburkholderia dioscoreae TaxID=2604047 RepID=A0A5Q4Z5P4_9BURK|nr:protein of unknown function [Paraburkholderia dioscoreae]
MPLSRAKPDRGHLSGVMTRDCRLIAGYEGADFCLRGHDPRARQIARRIMRSGPHGLRPAEGADEPGLVPVRGWGRSFAVRLTWQAF